MRLSLCVHAWNEADALRRLVLSSLPALAVVQEWVILDHRSTDHTQDVLNELEGVLNERGVTLTRLSERRDLSAEFTFAKLRNLPLDAATNPLVMILDADFILGTAFLKSATRAIREITRRKSPYYGASFRVPVIWDHFTTDEGGVVSSHGRVWWHSRRARILHWPSVTYQQIGKWERIRRLTSHRTKAFALPNDGSLLVSANVKPPERLEYRRTMTLFMEDALAGKVDGSWLEAYERGGLRKMPPYAFDDAADLRGVRLHAPGLRLGA